MRLLKQEATNRTVIVAAVTGIRARVNRTAAEAEPPTDTTRMVNPNQISPS